MEFGAYPAYSYETVIEAAVLAEEAGFASVMVPDHYLMARDMQPPWDQPTYDALVQLGGVARETSTIEIGTLLSPITFRHPAVMAKAAVTLDEMSGGRFKLGLGVGFMDKEHEVFGIPFPSVGERFDLLEEVLQYLVAFFDPARPGYEGNTYRLTDFPHIPIPERPVPILIGGGGSHKVPRLAGTFASEFNLIGSHEPDDRRIRIQRAKEAAEQAGRDPDDLMVSMQMRVTGVDTQAELDDAIDQRAAEMGMEPDEARHLIRDLHLAFGTWDQVFEALHYWEELGIDRIHVLLWGKDWNKDEVRATFQKLSRHS